MKLHGLGALAERNFRLVFSSVTISALGDGVTTVALAFAVLEISGSATALGLVLAARQGSAAAITLAAGVWADRLPRHLVLVSAAAIVQGAVQAVVGTLLVTGHAEVWMLVVGGLVYGLADGFVIPTSQGLIPAVVSCVRLQQANALLGLSRSMLGVLGPAVGGVFVALGSPGSALLVDSATFFAAAWLLRRVVLSPRARVGPGRPVPRRVTPGLERVPAADVDLDDDRLLRDRQLRVDVAVRCWGRSSPRRTIPARRPGGWLVSCFGAGTIVGGLVALRYRPAGRSSCRASRRAVDAAAARARLAGCRSRCSSRSALVAGHRPRDPSRALVHRLPAACPRGIALTGQLLRRARLVRVDAARLGDRRAGRGTDRRHRDAGRDLCDRSRMPSR